MNSFLLALASVNSALQGLGGWLTGPMEFFSFLGSEDFFLLFLPLAYWCIDSALGLRIGVMLLLSNGLNSLFKVAMHGPRPYWVSDQVAGLASETSFGVPSGHAQIAAGVWGVAADGVKRTWGAGAAAVVIFLIGLSRLYLGVHFLHDVLLGWMLGGLLLWAFIKYWDPAAARLKQFSLANQVALAFAFSLAMILLVALIVFLSRGFVLPAQWIENATRGGGEAPNPFSLAGIVTAMGTLFGILAGAAWTASRGGFSARGPVWKRGLRYFVGLVGVAVFYLGLKAVFPAGDDPAALVFRYVRYTLVGAWVAAGAPWAFAKLQLSDNPNR
ncbi:MAG: phosphatase PAP2 family protein [Anaerolineales bacterium]|nr:phosphatase PAP2 family protein [Anaerolineales bacterium]